MRKLKVMIASFLGAIALVFTCVLGISVNAADTDLPYLASNDSRTSELAKNTIIASDANLEIKNTDGKSQKMTAENCLLGDYTAGMSAKSNGQGFTFTVKNDIVLTIKFGLVDGTPNKYAGTYTFGTISSGEVSNTSVNTIQETILGKSSNVSAKLTGADTGNNNRRIILYEVSYETYTSTNYTASFNLNEGTGTAIPNIVIAQSASESDRTITLPTTDAVKPGYAFNKWSDGTNLYSAGDSYVLSSNVTFTATWSEHFVSGDETYFNFKDALFTGDVTSTKIINGTIYTAIGTSSAKLTISNNNLTYNEVKYTTRLQFNGTGTCTSETKSRLLQIDAPSKGVIRILTKTSSAGRYLKLYDENCTEKYSVSAPTTGTMMNFKVDAAGTYYLCAASGGVDIWTIDFVEMSDLVTATLLKQFDDDDNPTKLRLMGKIEGIAYADYSNISSVLMEFDFNKAHKSAYCYGLYKSIATLDDSLGADENGETMYVVLTIGNVDKYTGNSLAFTNVKMTITYFDGSTTIATHNDIALA